jgi:hypothetical protein
MANRMPTITLTGADGLIELLRTFPEKQLLPAVNKGMRAVGSKTISKAKSYLRKGYGLDTGMLKKSLGIRKIKTYKREGRVVMLLGPRRGFAIGAALRAKVGGRKGHDPYSIAHLVEFGHKIAGSSKSVMSKPFLRPAVDANRNEFNKQMIEKLRGVLEKAKVKAERAALPVREWPVDRAS